MDHKLAGGVEKLPLSVPIRARIYTNTPIYG